MTDRVSGQKGLFRDWTLDILLLPRWKSLLSCLSNFSSSSSSSSSCTVILRSPHDPSLLSVLLELSPWKRPDEGTLGSAEEPLGVLGESSSCLVKKSISLSNSLSNTMLHGGWVCKKVIMDAYSENLRVVIHNSTGRGEAPQQEYQLVFTQTWKENQEFWSPHPFIFC